MTRHLTVICMSVLVLAVTYLALSDPLPGEPGYVAPAAEQSEVHR